MKLWLCSMQDYGGDCWEVMAAETREDAIRRMVQKHKWSCLNEDFFRQFGHADELRLVNGYRVSLTKSRFKARRTIDEEVKR